MPKVDPIYLYWPKFLRKIKLGSKAVKFYIYRLLNLFCTNFNNIYNKYSIKPLSFSKLNSLFCHKYKLKINKQYN